MVSGSAGLAAAQEIEISTRRGDGTLRQFVPIWFVTVDGAIYVRSYRGPAGAWYRHVTDQQAAVVSVDGDQTEMTADRIDTDQDQLMAAIDAAYRGKYARYGDSYLRVMLGEQAVETTLRLARRRRSAREMTSEEENSSD